MYYSFFYREVQTLKIKEGPSDVHQFVCRTNKKINFPPDGKWALNLLEKKNKARGRGEMGMYSKNYSFFLF